MKVSPKNDDVRRLLAHPTAGKFRAEGSSDWPDDSFTNRRLADGDIIKDTGKLHEENKSRKAKAE